MVLALVICVAHHVAALSARGLFALSFSDCIRHMSKYCATTEGWEIVYRASLALFIIMFLDVRYQEMFNTSPFHILTIPEDVKVVFVQDFLLKDLVGGAELSMDALHKSAPNRVAILRSSQLTKSIVKSSKNKHWVFGNFAQLDPELMQFFATSDLSYSIYEHDYKFCQWRSVERHMVEGGEHCDCQQRPWGKLVESFFLNSRQLWFCSVKQMERYFERFPSLRGAKCDVLSATFGEEFFARIIPLIQSLPSRKKSGWLTLQSDSWIKGTQDAVKWLQDQGLEYRLISGMTPDQVLEAMANAEGFVCIPRGADVSNRMVTEAKLLGCKVVTNQNVQHVGEEWLECNDLNLTLKWLYDRRSVFWNRTMELCR